MKLFGFHIISDSAIREIEAGCSKIQGACDIALEKIERKDAEIKDLKNRNSVLEKALRERPPQMQDLCYANALETIQKQRVEIDKLNEQIYSLNETLDGSIARRDALERQIERMLKLTKRGKKPVFNIKANDDEIRNRSCHFYMKPSVFTAVNRLARENKQSLSGMLEIILTDKLTGGK